MFQPKVGTASYLLLILLLRSPNSRHFYVSVDKVNKSEGNKQLKKSQICKGFSNKRR